ncbi:MAG TPA: NAD(P)/FAD-dependent oxidoreductase [Steroidobacteraceae bacterium]|jgi:cation diffusion facilitator CzcD-associated flavoprotein CzcO
MTPTHVDVLIIGGGLSGVAAAYHLKKRCRNKSFAILEARNAIGGTWDLFRYPGVRSDSDMFTLGYSFRPWLEGEAIANGDKILAYIRAAAIEYGIDKKIQFGLCAKRASWSSSEATWTVEAERADTHEVLRYTCNFLFSCSGYYHYGEGYLPAFPGSEAFQGLTVHPQKWPAELDYAGKQVVVIGSGATAVTLVPAMAKSAAKVTMLQRSPTYMFSRPNADKLADRLRKLLPTNWAYRLIRWRNILFGIYFFGLCKRSPERVKKWLIKQVEGALGSSYDVATHFTPRYNPWDQRMCLVPDGDLFEAIKAEKARVITDQIDHFTPHGIKLKSGAELPADIIVTATGLNLIALGGMQVRVDGRVVDIAKTLSYKGTMYSGVPNLASAFGYTNASWTLKAELTCDYVCRVLNYMDAKGTRICVPFNEDRSVQEEPWLNLNSGYILRVADKLPKQGSKAPWRLRQNYVLDILNLRHGALDDGVLKFSALGLPGTSRQPR